MRTWPFLQNAMVFPLSRLAARMRAIGGGLHNGAYRKRGEESHAHRPDRDIALAHAVLFRPCAGDEERDDRRCERPRRRARGAARRPGEMPRFSCVFESRRVFLSLLPRKGLKSVAKTWPSRGSMARSASSSARRTG